MSYHPSVSGALLFLGCLGYAAYTHSWPWWLIGAAIVSFLLAMTEVTFVSERKR